MNIRLTENKNETVTITPDITVSEIISGLEQAFFLAASDGRIIISNHEAEMITGGPNTGISIYDIFHYCSDLKREISCMVSGRPYNTITSPLFVNYGDRHNIFRIQLQSVKNRSKELIGIIIILFRHTALEEFLKSCRITPRQIEITSMASAGLSNRTIAGKLQLSERTVENHLFNIYNKIGINNRMELITIISGYTRSVPDSSPLELFFQGSVIPSVENMPLYNPGGNAEL